MMDVFDDVLFCDDNISLEEMIDSDIRACNLDTSLGDFHGIARFTPSGLSNSSCDLLARLSPSAALLDGISTNLDLSIEHEFIGNAWFGNGYGAINYDQYYDSTLGAASMLVNPQTGLPVGSVKSPVTVQATISNVNIKNVNLVCKGNTNNKISAPIPVQNGKVSVINHERKMVPTPPPSYVFTPVAVQIKTEVEYEDEEEEEEELVVPVTPPPVAVAKPKPVNGVRVSVLHPLPQVNGKGKDSVIRVDKLEVAAQSRKGGKSQDRSDGLPKPPYSYSCLIAMALNNSTTGRLPVSEIYSFMCLHFPWFLTAPAGWKNSVRHNLSLNKCFQKIEKPPCKNGSTRKGYFWTMHADKVSKMHDEVIKWTRKDPQAIKKAMRKPENLELLEHGRLKFEPKIVDDNTEEEDEEYEEPPSRTTTNGAKLEEDSDEDESDDDDSDDSTDLDVCGNLPQKNGHNKRPQLQRLGSYLNDILVKTEPEGHSSPDYERDYPDIKVDIFTEEPECQLPPVKLLNGKRAEWAIPANRKECRRVESNGIYVSATAASGLPTKCRKIAVS